MAKYQSGVSLPRGRAAPMKRREVLHILGDNRPAFGCRNPKQILVRHSDEV